MYIFFSFLLIKQAKHPHIFNFQMLQKLLFFFDMSIQEGGETL
jgi:hypothetical protein